MKKVLKLLFLLGLLVCIICSVQECFYENTGISISKGKVGGGSLENAHLMPFSGENFSAFSFISYYLADNAYTNNLVVKTLTEAYKTCEITCPEVDFSYMECSNKEGGKMRIHKTHQNGLSVDFMVPKIRNNCQTRIYDYLGYFHYLLEFNTKGQLNFHKSVEIDFETMGKHILALDDAAKRNGLAIKMVILKLDLKDNFFKTESGKEVRKRGIYFAQSLPDWTNRMHDDHYHVDFMQR